MIYPIGDPSGAESSFDQINSSGGTDIAEGVEVAIAALTSGGSDITGLAGIVVLTDGEDSSASNLIDQINDAKSKGIRVSFGFLAPSTDFFEPDLLAAILHTGGAYTSFDAAEAIQSFLFLVLSNGLVANDVATTSNQPLLPGVTVAKLSGADPVTFTYDVRGGEVLEYTVASLSNQELTASLANANGDEITTNNTSIGPAVLHFDGLVAEELFLTVQAMNDTKEGVFQVSLNSSFGFAGCNLNNTPVANNGTGSPVTPTPNPTTVPVSAALRAVMNCGVAIAGLAATLLFL